MAVETMDAKVKPSCGEILQQARESLSLQLSEVATQLKLPVSRLIEIETSELDASVSATFYRGYIRSYARLVKLDPEPLLASFNETVVQDTEVTYSPSLAQFKSKKEMTTRHRLFKWLSIVIVLLILVAVSWGLKERFAESSSLKSESQLLFEQPLSLASEATEVTEAMETAAPVAEDEALTEKSAFQTEDNLPPDHESRSLNIESSESLQTETRQQNDDTLAAPVESNITQEEQLIENEKTLVNLDELVLAFVGDCWVEITDATGERLAFGLKKNGKVMTLQGKPPFKILLGDPSVVSLQHNQQMIDLSGYGAGRSVTIEID
jgi:cytoskeleton protein RodZ